MAKTPRWAGKLPKGRGRLGGGPRLRGPTSVAAGETKFNPRRGFSRRRHKLPFLHGIKARLHQQRVAAQCARTFHAPVRIDDHFDLDPARYVHAPREFGLGRSKLGLDLALALFGRRLRQRLRSQSPRQRHAHKYFANPTGSHRHYSSSEWDTPALEKARGLPALCGAAGAAAQGRISVQAPGNRGVSKAWP